MNMRKNLVSVINRVNSNSADGRVCRALILSFIGAGFSKFLILLMNVVLSRILGGEGYGRYSLVNSTIQTFVTFASMGLGASVVHYVAILRNHEKEKCGQVIGSFIVIITIMSIVMIGLMFFSSGFISNWTTGNNSLDNLYKLASFIILFIAICSIMQNILIGYESYRKITINEVIYGLVSIIASVVCAYLWGVFGALIGLLFARISYASLLTLSAKKESRKQGIRWKIKFDSFIWKTYKTFTFPSFISSIFVIPVNWVLNSLLVKNSGFYDMAVYSIAVQWVAIVHYITSLFSRTKSIYTQLFSEHNFTEFRKQLFRIIRTSSAIGISISALCCIFSKAILGIYGQEYLSQQHVFIIMMIATVIVTLQSQFGSVFESIDKVWIGFALNIVWAVNLTFGFLLLKGYGAFGYSIAYLVAYSLHCLYSWIVFTVLFKIEERMVEVESTTTSR